MNYDYRYEPKPHRGEPLYWSPLVDAMRDHGLTENKARIYLMRVIEKKSYDEICVRLGISRQTAHGHLLRALVALQQVPGA